MWGRGLLQITPSTIVCSSLKKTSFCLYLQLIDKVSAGLKIGLFLEKDFCGTVRSLKRVLLLHRASVHGKPSLW